MSTRNRTEAPGAAGPMTQMQIAGVKTVGDPPAGLFRTAAPFFIVQSPKRAQ